MTSYRKIVWLSNVGALCVLVLLLAIDAGASYYHHSTVQRWTQFGDAFLVLLPTGLFFAYFPQFFYAVRRTGSDSEGGKVLLLAILQYAIAWVTCGFLSTMWFFFLSRPH